jgi:hypothetical protein
MDAWGKLYTVIVADPFNPFVAAQFASCKEAIVIVDVVLGVTVRFKSALEDENTCPSESVPLHGPVPEKERLISADSPGQILSLPETTPAGRLMVLTATDAPVLFAQGALDANTR